MPRRKVLQVPDHIPPSYSLVLALAIVALDYWTSPLVEFPGLIILPLVLAAWYGGYRWGLPMTALPFAHVINLQFVDPSPDLFLALLTSTVRAVVLVPIVMWISSAGEAHRALKNEVEMLEGLLPICSYCKRIRDDGGEWQALEKYIGDRSAATFTHGVCETCLEQELAASPPRRRVG